VIGAWLGFRFGFALNLIHVLTRQHIPTKQPQCINLTKTPPNANSARTSHSASLTRGLKASGEGEQLPGQHRDSPGLGEPVLLGRVVRGCVGAWMCWCVDVLVCGCVGVWMCWCVGMCWCVDVLVCGCVGVWMCWCVDVLVCGCVGEVGYNSIWGRDCLRLDCIVG